MGLLLAYTHVEAHRMVRVMHMKRNKLWIYLTAIAIPEAVGALAGILTQNGVEAFQQLPQSELTPPGIVFPIVWTILYALMGISLARIWLAPESPERTWGLSLFLFQLIFNFFWSFFFFNMQAYFFSLLWIIVLWALIGLMIRSFYKTDKLAAWLQIPYLLWVTFATYLTYAAWQLNG